ncbi:Ig-like domain-containing protein [Bacillus cereus]|uniref:Ig-like domain-containing protein n=1 Tax=Bacillus cereus TaxID=1396 RepID=UPI0025702A02|nr:Ig-like domain-containing protein [Bacillus cereus]MDM5461435.1 Ig-like domain-containing protein [Bacillus cereus]WJE26717.1 Ig-like domain-containing protein [Bacillus cereus]
MLAAFQQKHIRKFSPITNTSTSRLNIQPNPPKISIAPSVISVIGVHMGKNKLKIKTGQSTKLSASVLPMQATNQELIWTNMNSDVITIYPKGDTVTITGKSAGRAVVIVTTAEGKFRDLCVVHVQPYMTNPK